MGIETIEQMMINKIKGVEDAIKALKNREKALLAKRDKLNKTLEDLEAKASSEESDSSLVEKVSEMVGEDFNQDDIMSSLSEIRERRLKKEDYRIMSRSIRSGPLRKLEQEIQDIKKDAENILCYQLVGIACEFEAEYNELLSNALTYPATWKKVVWNLVSRYELQSGDISLRLPDKLRPNKKNSLRIH